MSTRERVGRKLIAIDLERPAGVDDPAHGEPGWLMMKSKAGAGPGPDLDLDGLEAILRKASDIEQSLDDLLDALESAAEGLKDAPAEVKVATNVLYAWLKSLPDPDAGDEMGYDNAGGPSDIDTVTKAAGGKTEGGVVYPKSDYAYTPSDEPSTWRLRLTTKPGGPLDRSMVGRAIAALKDYRGNKVQIPADDLPAVKAKLRAAWHKVNPDRSDDEMPSSLTKARPSVLARALSAVLGLPAATVEEPEPKPVVKAGGPDLLGEIKTFATSIAKAAAISNEQQRHAALAEAVTAFVSGKE